MAPPPLALTYHGVADVPLAEDPSRLFTRPSDLVAHVRLLRRWGYRLVTFGELAAHACDGAGDGYAALTFDDGFADNHDTLLPLLREIDVTATVFVVSGWLGGTHPEVPGAPILRADQVRALSDAGVEIGAHSSTHADLSSLDYDAALAEWRDCRDELERLTSRAVTVAAYPGGRVSDDAARACGDAGLAVACLTEGEGSWDDPLRCPRQSMSNRDTRAGLWFKRHGWYERLMGPVRPLLRSRPGRHVVGVSRAVRRRLE